MSSLALDVFHRLKEQVDEIERTAARCEIDGFSSAAPILRRSAYVLAVASLDTYFHEQAARLLYASALSSASSATRVAGYVGRVSAADVSGNTGESYIRLGLSYKTLVAPTAIDGLLIAVGLDPVSTWRDVSFILNNRPDRLKLQLQLHYDRRNQVAHEGDWDLVQLDFRIMRSAHLEDCLHFATQLVESMDEVL